MGSTLVEKLERLQKRTARVVLREGASKDPFSQLGSANLRSGRSRGGARGARPPLFLDQTEKNFFGDRASPLSQGLDDRPPPFPPPPPLCECLDPPLLRSGRQQHMCTFIFKYLKGSDLYLATDPSTLHSESDSHNYIIRSN